MAWNQFPPYELAVIFDVLHGRRQQFLERAPMFGRPTAPRHTLTEVPATENGRSQQNVPLKCIVQPLCVHLALRTLWHENWRRATKSTRVTVHLRKCVENGALRGCQQRHHVQTAKRILRRRRGSTTKPELLYGTVTLCYSSKSQHRTGHTRGKGPGNCYCPLQCDEAIRLFFSGQVKSQHTGVPCVSRLPPVSFYR